MDQRRTTPPQKRFAAEQITVVTKGGLGFGPWEQIVYAGFDGKRKKSVLVKIIYE